MQYLMQIFLAVVLNIFLFAGLSHAEKVTFVKEYTYQASDLDSKVSSRTIALEQVKRLLLEELGTYLISETEVKNFRLTKDQITTYSAGVVSAEVVDEKWDGKTYYLKARVSADPSEVIKSLQNIVNDKHKAKELEDVRKKAAEFSKEIEKLKKELELTKANTKKPEQKADEKKVEQYNEAVKGLSATDWFETGFKSAKSHNFKEAVDAFTKAIQLNPQFAMAYAIRGLSHYFLHNPRQAIKDCNKTIELKPDGAYCYWLRGEAYRQLGNYQQTIEDSTKAIELESDNALFYNSRGRAYFNFNDQQAIKDFSTAIQLKPDDAESYYGRGVTYSNMGNYQQAIEDSAKAIVLKSDYAEAYYFRGTIYGILDNHQQAINDYKIAARLEHKEAQDFLKQKGIGW